MSQPNYVLDDNNFDVGAFNLLGNANAHGPVEGLPLGLAGGTLVLKTSSIDLGEGVPSASHGVAGAAFQSSDTSGTLVITDTPPTGKTMVLYDLWWSTDTAMVMTITESLGPNQVLFQIFPAANSSGQITLRNPITLSQPDSSLSVTGSAAGSVCIMATYGYKD